MREATPSRSNAGRPEGGSRRYRALARTFRAAALLAPPALVAALIFVYAVDVPILDQWDWVPDLARYATGTWTLAELLRSSNGHRLLVPRLVLLPLAFLTGWNVRVEMGLAWLAAGAALVFVLGGARRGLRAAGASGLPAWLAIACSIAFFSLAQWENWLWGLTFHTFLTLALASGALLVLTKEHIGAGSLLGAILLCVAATFTMAAGLVVWPVGFLLLAWRGAQGREPGALRWAAAWALGGSLLCAFYLHPMPGDANMQVPLAAILRDPLACVRFALSVLGTPVASFGGSAWPPRDSGEAFAAACIGVAALSSAFLRAARLASPSQPSLAFPASLALFSGGVAAEVALARTSDGPAAALASRYVTLSIPFWVALLILLALLIAADPRARVRRAASLCAAACVLLLGLSSLSQLPRFAERHDLLAPARRELVRGARDDLLERLHPDVGLVKAERETLRRLHLSVFRPGIGPLSPPASTAPLRSRSQEVVVLNRPTFLCAGLEYRYRIRVTNPGPGPWPALGDARGVGGVHLSYHWLESGSQRVLSEGTRSYLRDDLPPGGAATLEASVHAPARPGRYTLVFSMVQEGVAWLEDAGPRARSPVSVERCWGRFHDGPGSDLRPPGRRDARSPWARASSSGCGTGGCLAGAPRR